MSLSSLFGIGAGAVLQAFHRSQAMISFSPDGTILEAKENFCRAMGYEEKEIVGRHHRTFVDANEADLSKPNRVATGC